MLDRDNVDIGDRYGKRFGSLSGMWKKLRVNKSRANERALINHSVGFYDGKQFARAITGRNVVLVDALIAASGPSLLFPPCKCRLSLENLEGKQVFVTGCEGYILLQGSCEFISS